MFAHLSQGSIGLFLSYMQAPRDTSKQPLMSTLYHISIDQISLPPGWMHVEVPQKPLKTMPEKTGNRHQFRTVRHQLILIVPSPSPESLHAVSVISSQS